MRWLLLLVIVAGCSHDRRSPDPLHDPHRWDCAADAECRNSCNWGAVNRAWYERASSLPDFNECEDGCADQDAQAPRCESGGCVAYFWHPDKSVTPFPDCTRREPR